jgi:tetratricopeptide (TPR) repeat protein
MKTPAGADIQRWSDEVARDPRSLAFLPLARAYRRQGLRDLAMQLCLRGLDAYPSHAEAHGLLALLYLEAGDHQRAADEWSMVLRVDASNFDALRGMGFCYLEQDKLSRARQMLERAALQRPADATVQEALRVLGTRQELAEQGISARADAAPGDDPRGAAGARPHSSAERGAAAPAATVPAPPARTLGAGARTAASPAAAGAPAATAPAAPAPPPAALRPATSGGAELPADPGSVFDELLAAGPLLGVLLVDAQGLVLAGRLGEGVPGDASMLGAMLGGAVDEAARTVAHLELGGWRGILLESAAALLHLSPAKGGAVVVLVARRDTPAGWLLRAAAQAGDHAARYAEAYG